MQNQENASKYTAHEVVSMLVGWTPSPIPVHRLLEVEAMEMIDIGERDFAARVAFQRRSVR